MTVTVSMSVSVSTSMSMSMSRGLGSSCYLSRLLPGLRVLILWCVFVSKVDIMTKNLWICHDLVQKAGIGKDGLVDLGELFFVAQLGQEILVDLGECKKIFSSTIVRRQLEK